MNERAAFLTAIATNPDDDAPLLVFADWLDDHGEPKKALRIRRACVRLSDEQWAALADAAALMWDREGNELRLVIGQWGHLIDSKHGAPELGRQLVRELKHRAEAVRKRLGLDLRAELVEKRINRWMGAFVEEFKTPYAFQALAPIVARKVKARGVQFKDLGVGSTDLAAGADGLILGELAAADDYRTVDPRTIPNLGERLREKFEGFDPFAFDWSRAVPPFGPKTRQRLKAAGFKFSTG